MREIVRIVVASYNVHGAVGLDRRFAPERIAAVLDEIGADVIALQELDVRGDVDVLVHLREHGGWRALSAPTVHRAGGGEFGNGLLTHFAVRDTRRHDLSVARREPRGALDAVLDCAGTPLRVIATHLGLHPTERQHQIARLLEAIRGGPQLPTVLLGDLNEWWLRRRSLRALHAHFGAAPAHATFPSLLPLLALDRVWVAPAAALYDVRVHRSRLARRASDHLPLVATLELPLAA
jgi:endonuclease/exonuclease/phosphatase family metal-dependent hydrolase